jgi:hypothetical protein
MKCTQNSAGGTNARLPAGQPRKGTSIARKYVCTCGVQEIGLLSKATRLMFHVEGKQFPRGENRPRREADDSPLSSAKGMNE